MSEGGRKIRVLIVDDSFFMRKLIKDLLDIDSEIEVAGEANDGIGAIEGAGRLEPDVILMDYNMPQMNGAEATRKILERSAPLPVILMLSAYTTEGADETLESLRAGAVDFISKPSGELSLDIDKVKEEIILKVKKLASVKVQKFERIKAVKKIKKQKVRDAKIIAKAIVIGASTGGPPVLEDILSRLPANLNAILIIIQHMPKRFTETFARRLDKISPLFIKEAEDGEVLKIGQAYVAPGGTHMKIEKGKDSREARGEIIVHLTREPVEYGIWPAIDVSMTSLANYYPYEIMGIILTGMGEDGLEGMRAIKAVKGHTIVQDPATAVVGSMPKTVIKEGLADEILSPDEITKRIIEFAS